MCDCILFVGIPFVFTCTVLNTHLGTHSYYNYDLCIIENVNLFIRVKYKIIHLVWAWPNYYTYVEFGNYYALLYTRVAFSLQACFFKKFVYCFYYYYYVQSMSITNFNNQRKKHEWCTLCGWSFIIRFITCIVHIYLQLWILWKLIIAHWMYIGIPTFFNRRFLICIIWSELLFPFGSLL